MAYTAAGFNTSCPRPPQAPRPTVGRLTHW